MPASETFVATDRAARYVEQLTSHFAHEPGGMRAGSEGEGHLAIDLGVGICSLWAEPAGLRLRAEASDRDGLDRIKQRFGARLEQIGHRDGLEVNWPA